MDGPTIPEVHLIHEVNTNDLNEVSTSFTLNTQSSLLSYYDGTDYLWTKDGNGSIVSEPYNNLSADNLTVSSVDGASLIGSDHHGNAFLLVHDGTYFHVFKIVKDELTVDVSYLQRDDRIYTYEAIEQLNSSAELTGNMDVHFKSGDSIELDEGFTVNEGALLEVSHEGCPQ